MTASENALAALQAVNFDWTRHVKSIWQPSPSDVSSLHHQDRATLIQSLNQLKLSNSSDSPLGSVIRGLPGSGKTHLLSVIRRHALTHDISFILVDMTDVRDFWETVVQGYVSSLQEEDENGIPQFQLKQLIEHLVSRTGRKVSSARMAALSPEAMHNGIKAILNAIAKTHRQQAIRFQDIIRAVVLLNADEFETSGIACAWLQGMEIDEVDKRKAGFRAASMPLSDIVKGLSWVMSLRGPSVLALDQLDSVVTQHHYIAGITADNDLSEEQRVSKSIIEGIGGGLMALRDVTTSTLTLVSCLPVTWEILARETVQAMRDRFRSQMLLSEITRQAEAERLIALRLQPVYQQNNISSPYATWPFHSDFFADATHKGVLPRKILQQCDQHRQKCLAEGKVSELKRFAEIGPIDPGVVDFKEIEGVYQAAQQSVNITQATQENHEDDILGQWFQTVGECLVQENPTGNSVDSVVEASFPGGRNYPQLHARVRLVYRDEGDREKHLCLRALLRSHHSAYRARLKAAMTTSGIDRALSFRRLMLVRTEDIPGGASTQQLTQQFTDAGGILAYPSEAELRVLGALHQLKGQNLLNFQDWLRQTRPASQLPFLQETVSWLFDNGAASESAKPLVADSSSGSGTPSLTTDNSFTDERSKPDIPTSTHSLNGNGRSVSPQPLSSQSTQVEGLPIGKRLMGKQAQAVVAIPLESLTKHVVVLAGSGAGKTVLVRRLVEEAALQGIPAIVMDCANDLARMGDPWPAVPEAWSPEDQTKAERYHQNTEVVVWTPGREAGNALNLSPLPDFAALASNPDELEQAIDMARDSLQDIVASGNATTARIKRGVLRTALEHFASQGGGSLESFAEFLNELPPEASGNIARASKRAQEMADLLNAEIANNPLLRQSGTPLDPAVLLGLDSANSTRLSIINCIGLPGLTQQQQFLNQLAMTLFTWIKKNPAPAGQPLRGLLVIDEAKDFLPSQQTTPCKSSLIRLAAQARKYGLGLIFATQAPKSIDHNVIANCSTQFYGRANSPSAIDIVRDQLRQRGGDGQDIARLERGQFYAASETIGAPIKIATSLCLSHHPSTPLGENEVLQRARPAHRSQPNA